MEITEIKDKKVSSNLPIVEICIPKSLQDQGLTIRGFIVQTYLHLHRKDNLDYATPKLKEDIRKLISRKWLVLIGVSKEYEASN
jgi:hypothetical protein